MDETRRTFFDKSKYGPTGKPRFKFPEPTLNRKEVMEERKKLEDKRKLKQQEREKEEFIEDRMKSRTLKKPKEQSFQDGGLAVRGTGAQVKKTTFKGVF
tara:strand:+ start:144 stop:440 length:297 start_codon:yes stop_codon:yes gene_type:complete